MTVGKMSLETEIIYKLKTYHKGKDNAITYKSLAFVLDINERQLRNVVSEIVKSGKACLCSTSKDGYYFPENESEFNHAQAEDISRIKELAKKHRGRRLAWRLYRQSEIEKPYQLEMIV